MTSAVFQKLESVKDMCKYIADEHYVNKLFYGNKMMNISEC